ncbi:Ferric iron ABC transporter, ATP-binding protein [hydrothermal vent metagenome]|uniref:Ferric iron ABC transporter, ATP-binding protein n=1 Tax=hydrothermal vent metagenome TaxID=652676 RepID=A0A3B0ZB65_9ZZZZ
MTPLLDVQGIECQYDGQSIFQNLSLQVNPGSFTCLLGKSGCGKTTALRAIAGFEPVTTGEIVLRGVTASRAGYILAPEKRNIGMVFQDYALFPHMDVMDNICFGLRKISAMAKRKTASQLLKVVGLESFNERYPHELSGGQQQRVALARALAARPDLILMDEPFSNLDVDLRERIGIEVRDILKNEGIASILVTHDQQEAFVLADLIGVMDQGRIVQWDTPPNLYHKPINHFIAEFIGQGVFLKGTLLSPETVETDVGLIKGNIAHTLPTGSKVDVLLRPDDIIPAPDSPLRSKVTQRAFKGASILYTLQLTSGDSILALFPSHYDYNIGEQVGFQLNAQHLIFFSRT